MAGVVFAESPTSRAEPLFRGLAGILSILVAALWVFGPGNDPAATTAETIISVLVLGAVPLVAFWSTPGALWVKATAFGTVFAAAIAATVYILPDDAVGVVDMWYEMLMVGGGCLVWWIWHNSEEPPE